MSRFGTVVLLPTTSPAEVAAAIAEVMAPFAIDQITGRGEWDHYRIDGDLLHRARFDGSPAVIRTPGQAPLHCAGGPKRMLDFPAMRAVAAAEARAQWREWQTSPGGPAFAETDDPADFRRGDERAFLETRTSQAATATTMVTLAGQWVDEGTEGDYPSSLRRQATELAALDEDALIVHLACHG